jgi:hypothetical protein
MTIQGESASGRNRVQSAQKCVATLLLDYTRKFIKFIFLNRRF